MKHLLFRAMICIVILASTGVFVEHTSQAAATARQPFPQHNYFTSFFAAPLGVAAMTQPSQQQWLNAIYDSVRTAREGYFEDSVNQLCMLVMTGNYWDPTSSVSVRPTKLNFPTQALGTSSTARTINLTKMVRPRSRSARSHSPDPIAPTLPIPRPVAQAWKLERVARSV